MSKYTTEVRFICEKEAGFESSVGYSDVEEVLSKSWNKIFGNFPIFDESYRPILCTKILRHYYTREIGFETVGLWKLKLNTLMQEIMPFYNQLYESALLKFNPLQDADYTREHEGQDTGESTDSGSHTGTVQDEANRDGTVSDHNTQQLSESSWDIYSDTPQGALTNVENGTYLTNARKLTRSSETTTENEREYAEDNENLRTYNEQTGLEREFSNTSQYIEHIKGKFPGKSYSSLLQEFRDTFLNIDVDVIASLGDLFMKLW